MNQEEPTVHELLEQQHRDNLDRQILGDKAAVDVDETGPQIDITVDGHVLTDVEVEALLQKPVEELSDAEREALQPFFDEAEEQSTHVQVDPLTLAGKLLVGAFEDVSNGKAINDRRVAQRIALAHAMSAHAHAAAARMHAQVAAQQLQMMQHAQQLMAGKQGGPASSIVVPTVHLPNGRG